MCLAIPGKVVKLNAEKAIVDYGFEKREADNSLIKAKPGDWVLVQYRMIVQKLSEKEAREVLRAVEQAKGQI